MKESRVLPFPMEKGVKHCIADQEFPGSCVLLKRLDLHWAGNATQIFPLWINKFYILRQGSCFENRFHMLVSNIFENLNLSIECSKKSFFDKKVD